MTTRLLTLGLAVLVLGACTRPLDSEAVSKRENGAVEEYVEGGNEPAVATLGAGCFWCVEAVLEQVDGILKVESGYMGGHVDNPTYEEVCTKKSGHVEVVQVSYDPEKISYDAIIAWFWKLHDPTSRDKQGNDAGPQYRSAIFYHSDAQRDAAEASLKKHQPEYSSPIVTEILEAKTFWVAEDDHQNYYRLNRQQGYCRFVIAPKLDKLGLEK